MLRLSAGDKRYGKYYFSLGGHIFHFIFRDSEVCRQYHQNFLKSNIFCYTWRSFFQTNFEIVFESVAVKRECKYKSCYRHFGFTLGQFNLNRLSWLWSYLYIGLIKARINHMILICSQTAFSPRRNNRSDHNTFFLLNKFVLMVFICSNR